MKPTLELRDLIKTALSGDGYAVYPDEAPKEAQYPYIVFGVSKSSAEIYPFVGILTVDVWDKHRTHSTVNALMDTVEEKIRHQVYSNDKVMFRAFDGDRNTVIDEDKSIKRISEKFMIRFSVKGE